jgi:hypothetical protein
LCACKKGLANRDNRYRYHSGKRGAKRYPCHLTTSCWVPRHPCLLGSHAKEKSPVTIIMRAKNRTGERLNLPPLPPFELPVGTSALSVRQSRLLRSASEQYQLCYSCLHITLDNLGYFEFPPRRSGCRYAHTLGDLSQKRAACRLCNVIYVVLGDLFNGKIDMPAHSTLTLLAGDKLDDVEAELEMRIQMASEENHKYKPRRLSTMTIRVQSEEAYKMTVERCLRVFIRSGILDNSGQFTYKS